MTLRNVLAGALVSVGLAALAADAEKPAAVQVCLSLPAGVPLFLPHPQPEYRPLGEGVFMLDLDLALSGQLVTKLTRSGADCVRAWVPAQPVSSVAVSFSRTALNLAPAAKPLDLKLKADLWFDAGRLSVAQLPWSSVKLRLPGQLVLERQGPSGFSPPLSDFSKVPAGVYRMRFQQPQSMLACDVTVRASAVGSIREDNRKQVVDELVAHYTTEYVPEVLADLKMHCEPDERVQVEVLLVDGVFFKPREPTLRKVKVPSKAPRFALEINGVRTAFSSGQLVTVKTDQAIVLEESLEVSLAATP